MKTIDNPKYISLLFWLCWIAYFATYLGRLNYNAAMSEIIKAENITKAQAGLVGTASFFSYGIGQLINGIIGDKVSSKRMLFFGLTLSTVANVFMGFSVSVPQMIATWLINGFAQSMTWAPIVKLLSRHLEHKKSVKAMVNISTSVAVGTLGAYGMTAGVIVILPWRAVFFIAAAVMGIVAIIWYFGISVIEKHNESYEEVMEIEETTNQKVLDMPLFKIMAVSGLMFVSIASILSGMLRDGVTTWTPALIEEQFYLGSSLSILLTAIIPFLNMSGFYAAHIINQKVFKNEILTSAFLFLCAAASLAVVMLGGMNNLYVLLLVLVITTSSMHGIGAINTGLLPLYFAKLGRASTVAGIMNSFIYLGSGISCYAIGAVSSIYGWGVNIMLWTLMSALGMVICLLNSKKWRGFCDKLSV